MENTMIHSFIRILDRDLGKLESEISQYTADSLLWKTAGEITNPPGNLCLHLCGNLQHYIGAQLGQSGYKRNRPVEFSAKNLTKADLLAEIARTKNAIGAALATMNDESLRQIYPEEVLGYPMTTGFFLIHLTGHFGYHLGQINYHRRLITSSHADAQSYH